MRPLLIIGAFLALCAHRAEAQTYKLYGITEGGVLEQIVEQSGTPYQRRAPLPTAVYRGLIHVNGYFYTYNTSGVLIRFGMSAGDEAAIGSTSYTVRGLAVRPSDGKVFASLASPPAVGEVNLATGAVSNVAALFSCNQQTNYFANLAGIAFYNNSEMFAVSYYTDVATTFFRINPATGETYGRKPDDTCVNTQTPPFLSANLTLYSVAINPVSQRVFAAEGGDISNTQKYYELNDKYPTTANSSFRFVGQLNEAGIPGHWRDIRGLTYVLSQDETNLIPSWYRLLLAN